MANKVLELREQRANAIAEARKLLDANETMTAESQEQWDRLMAETDRLETEIKTTERREHQSRLEADLQSTKRDARSAPHRVGQVTEADERRAFGTWLRHRAGLPVDSGDLDRNGVYNPFEANLELRTGLTVGTSGSGGYFAPTLFPISYERFEKYFCKLKDVCDLLVTTTGDSLPWPVIDITSITESITAETGTIPEGDPTTTSKTFGAYKVAESIKLSTELVRDAFVDMIPLVSSLIAEVLGRSQEVYFETGTGSSQPTGIVTAVSGLNNAAVSDDNSLGYGNLISLLQAVDPVYEPDCVIAGSNETKWQLRALVDSNGRPLWTNFMSPMTEGLSDMLMGHRYVTLSSIDDYSGSGTGTGTNNPFLLAFVPKKFMIRQVGGVTLSVNPYLGQQTGQIYVFGEVRVDSQYIGPARSTAWLGNN